MALLTSLSISGYKSIRNLSKFHLGQMNILIGANGAGKSNFISFFEFIYNVVTGKLQRYVSEEGGPDGLLFFGIKKTEKLYAELCFNEDSKEVSKYIINLYPAKDKILIDDETVFFHDKIKYPQKGYDRLIAKNVEESNLLSKANETAFNIERVTADFISSWSVFHFHDTSKTSKMKTLANIDDNAKLRPDASNLSALLYLMKQKYKEKYRRIVDSIRLVAPFFDDFSLRPHPLIEGKIKLEWKEKGSDQYFDGYNLSDGTLRFICLTTLLNQPNLPGIIIIDEPEIGLHPYAISVFASMLQNISENIQVIMSTQSGTLIDYFTTEDIIVVDNERGESVFRRYKEEELKLWLDQYSLGEIWDKRIIGGRPGL